MSMEVKSALPQMFLTDALEKIAAPALGVVCVMEASCSATLAEDAMGTEIGRLTTNATLPVHILLFLSLSLYSFPNAECMFYQV